METSSSSGILAVTVLALLLVLVIVLAYGGVFNPQDGGGIHIGIGR
jgi:hypothetical protein